MLPLPIAGFAVNINLVRDHPNAVFSNDAKRGFLENDFLTSLGVEKHDLEPRADMCTTVSTRVPTPTVCTK